MAGLDELNGILTTVSIISVAWTDDMLNWVPPSNGNITDIMVQKNSIWSPKLVVINPASLVESMGTSAEQTYVLWFGRVVWTFGYVMYTTCDIDVTYFPFDTQECLLELMPIGILSKDMELISNPIDTTFYSENNIWKLESTSAETSYLGPQLYGKYSLKLKRRYTFYILNLFSPVLILAFPECDGFYDTSRKWGESWIRNYLPVVTFTVHDICIRKFAKLLATVANHNICSDGIHSNINADIGGNNYRTKGSPS